MTAMDTVPVSTLAQLGNASVLRTMMVSHVKDVRKQPAARCTPNQQPTSALPPPSIKQIGVQLGQHGLVLVMAVAAHTWQTPSAPMG